MPLPFRLRTVLGILLGVSFIAVTAPRVRAAWRLRSLVTKVSDYGLCMAGPTGAVALRDDVTRFRGLVRRRLVAAGAKDMPFARCGALAVAITGRAELGAIFDEPASGFIEWGAGGQRRSINEFLTVLPDLESLHRRSWPLVRKPLSGLMRPTRGAFEAVHPMELAKATPLRGLRLDGAIVRSSLDVSKGRYVVLSNERASWAFRSRDRGQSWSATSVWQSALEGHANHCVADTSGTRFAPDPTRRGSGPALLVGTIGGMTSERREFGRADEALLRVSCDDSGAVALTQSQSDRAYHVYACPMASNCHEVPLPPFVRLKDVAIDVGRVAHTIVVVASRDGLVRATTSRDEGVTMTPLSLVFDARDGNTPGIVPEIEPTLLGFGKRLELVLSAPAKGQQWALESRDFGGSFHSL